MLKSNLEICEYVHRQPGHVASADNLADFIGDNASRRLHDLVHARLLLCDSHWMDSCPAEYRLGPAGDELLAAHQHAVEEERKRKAEADAKQAADDAKAILDKKQDRRHDFKVAAFTVVLTLAIEHHSDLLDLFKRLLKAVGLLH